MHTIIEAGTLTASLADRIVTGLLVPFGEKCRSNLGRFTADENSFTIPADPDVVGLNREHQREKPIGRAATLTKTPQGIMASWKIAKTPEGDQLLAAYERNDPDAPRKLSVEVDGVRIKGGKAIAGTIFGGAIVKAGAWPSATLLAADTPDAEDVDDLNLTEPGDAADAINAEPSSPATDNAADEAADASPIAVVDPEDPDAVTTVENHMTEETDPDGSTWRTETAIVTTETPDAVTTVQTTTEALVSPATDPEGTTDMGNATAPATLTAKLSRRPANRRPASAEATGPTLAQLIHNLARGQATREPATLLASREHLAAGATLFAALEDVTFSGEGSVGDPINAIPQWLGELWNGRGFQRKIIPLIGSAPLTSMKIAGWRFTEGSEPAVAPYAGNKAAVPSNKIKTEEFTTTARRLAGAHDIDRAYRDFGVVEFWTAYFRAMTESYDRQADAGTLADLVTSATYTKLGTVPANVSKGMTAIVDGSLSIIDTALPTFAVVSKDLYRDFLLTRSDDMLPMLNASLGLEDGTVSAFRVVPDATLPSESVLVGASAAATSHELPGVPIRVEAEDIIKGGLDEGVFGYYGTVVHNAKALAMVTTTGVKPDPKSE
ncbi:hypothetical protein [Mycetocola saprophilus]|uniref:hypothetical protein n=1 Tax=Mycetocola saprophilus TaxID=76636 RepID=UPI003BF1EC0B